MGSIWIWILIIFGIGLYFAQVARRKEWEQDQKDEVEERRETSKSIGAKFPVDDHCRLARPVDNYDTGEEVLIKRVIERNGRLIYDVQTVNTFVGHNLTVGQDDLKPL